MAVVAPFLTGLGGSGVDFLGSLPPFGNSDAFFARMINMAMGILLNSSIKFDRLDRFFIGAHFMLFTILAFNEGR